MIPQYVGLRGIGAMGRCSIDMVATRNEERLLQVHMNGRNDGCWRVGRGQDCCQIADVANGWPARVSVDGQSRSDG